MKADVAGAKLYLNGPKVTATFKALSGAAKEKDGITVKGFWDGGSIWRIRFAPTAAGVWSYVTNSSDLGLNGALGTFTALASSGTDIVENPLRRGFLEPDGHSWKLSDGTLFLPTCDTQWSFSEEFSFAEWHDWVDVLKLRARFHKFANVFSIFRNMIEHLQDQRRTTSPGCWLYGYLPGRLAITTCT